MPPCRHLEAQLATEQRQKSELGGAQLELEERLKEMQFKLDEAEAEKAKAEDDLAASEKLGSEVSNFSKIIKPVFQIQV